MANEIVWRTGHLENKTNNDVSREVSKQQSENETGNTRHPKSRHRPGSPTYIGLQAKHCYKMLQRYCSKHQSQNTGDAIIKNCRKEKEASQDKDPCRNLEPIFLDCLVHSVVLWPNFYSTTAGSFIEIRLSTESLDYTTAGSLIQSTSTHLSGCFLRKAVSFSRSVLNVMPFRLAILSQTSAS